MQHVHHSHRAVIVQLRPTGWVSAIPDFRGRVIDLVTDTFPAYARIFHRPDQGLPHSDRPSSWAAMAEDRGTVFPPRPEQQPTRREGPDVAY